VVVWQQAFEYANEERSCDWEGVETNHILCTSATGCVCHALTLVVGRPDQHGTDAPKRFVPHSR
jgi:hypothetical protein